MRSQLIFGATANVPNRYLLVMLASKAARKLHRPNTRMEDTANDTFARFASTQPKADVPHSGNLQPFRPTVQDGAPAFCEDLVQSVA